MGLVQEHQQRMEPEPALVGRRPLLFGMHIHQAGIEVQRQPLRRHPRRPHPRPRSRPTRLQLGEQGLVDSVEEPPSGRLRGHIAEQLRLVTQHLQIRHTLAAVDQGER